MSYSLKATDKQIEAMLDYYKNEAKNNTVPYAIAQIKKDRVTITLYNSKKVLFQGKNAEHELQFWEDTFNLKNTQGDYFMSSIGSDESGVGDYFGPLTVCAAYVQEKDELFLRDLKIDDSKRLSDAWIKTIAPKLIKRIPYSLLVLSNPDYNRQIDKGYNAHKLKAYLHAQCHQHLLKKITKKPPIIVDQFCSEKLYISYLKSFKNAPHPTIFKTKAESHYASVAVASIIARYSFITQLDVLEKAYTMTLPKGASKRVDEAVGDFIKKHGVQELNQVAKLHFKTTYKHKA